MRFGPPPRIITFFCGVAFDLVVAAVVGGIIIRRVSLELGGAGVHEPVAGHEAEFFAQGADFVLGGPVKWAICRSEKPRPRQARPDPARLQPAVEGHAPLAGYAFYYHNQPDFLRTNLTLRLAVAPVYLDSELGFVHGLGPNTDFAIGAGGRRVCRQLQ
jgi:hypothetical protein